MLEPSLCSWGEDSLPGYGGMGARIGIGLEFVGFHGMNGSRFNDCYLLDTHWSIGEQYRTKKSTRCLFLRSDVFLSYT